MLVCVSPKPQIALIECIARNYRRLLPILSLVLLSGCRLHLTSATHEPSPPAWAGSLRGAGLSGFVLTEQLTRRSTTMVTATNRLGILKLDRLDGLDEGSAFRLIEDGMMGVEALYANALSPYPGDLSNTVITDSAYRPKRFSDGNHSAFLLFANDRMSYGSGTAEQVAFKSLLAWRYSRRSGELIKIRLYTAPGTRDEVLEQWLKSLHCE